MESIRFLFIDSGLLNKRFVLANVLACVATVAITGIVLAGTKAGGSTQNETSLFYNFVLYFGLFLGTRKYLLDRTADAVEEVICQIRTRICEQINRADLSAFQKIQKETIQLVLGKECLILGASSNQLMRTFAQLLMLISVFIYIAFISRPAFFFIAIAVAVMLLLHIAQTRDIKKEFQAASVQEEIFFKHLGSRLAGFNELRMNEDKARDLFENELLKDARETKALVQKTQRKLNRDLILVESVIYVLLGLTIFVLPDLGDAARFPVPLLVTLLLFANGPIGALAGSARVIYRANECVARIQNLQHRLSQLPQAPQSAAPSAPAAFERLQCEQLVFHYPALPGRPDDRFQLGPVDLDIKRGEIVFFVGGNGSGKSTLLHVLCGLYPPSSGRLLLNGQVVSQTDLQSYRSHFSIILQDFHLFHRLLGQRRIDLERVRGLLTKLNLHDVTNIDEEGRILSLNLSTGQKKRLALLAAEFDDREIFVFDEWAADQDPEFRRLFYERYLPELRASGSTILAATHDDKYFHLADRVFKLDRGVLIQLPTSS